MIPAVLGLAALFPAVCHAVARLRALVVASCMKEEKKKTQAFFIAALL